MTISLTEAEVNERIIYIVLRQKLSPFLASYILKVTDEYVNEVLETERNQIIQNETETEQI